MQSDKDAAAVPPTSALIDIEQVAHILGCSSRHVRRLIDSRRMPHPIKLGALTRWTKVTIDNWIAAGCPDCRKGGK